MNFNDANQMYLQLKQQYDSGQITGEYSAQVSAPEKL